MPASAGYFNENHSALNVRDLAEFDDFAEVAYEGRDYGNYGIAEPDESAGPTSASRRRLLRTGMLTAVGAGSVLAGVSPAPLAVRSVLAALQNAFMPDAQAAQGRSAGPMLQPYSFNASARDRAEWREFKQRFIVGGRVIDTGNQDVSHSEGQGWGMLFAVAFDDRQTFDALWSWTQSTLRRPDNALHAWRYDPAAAAPVGDWNNATDGDLFIAGALGRAARRWGDPSYAEAARAIGEAVLSGLVRTVGGRTLLLPGLFGFERSDATIINPSYYAFPMLTEIGAFAPSSRWEAVVRDGVGLIGESRFGRWALPPDWLRIDLRTGAMLPAPGWPARFSYDAIRVPLYLAWGQCLSGQLAEQFRDFWDSTSGGAAWIDLASGRVAPYQASAGMRAISQFVTQGGDEPSIRVPVMAEARDYYSAALLLLTRVAWRESRGVRPGILTRA